MEAMKMEMRLTAAADGTVAAVHVEAGGQAPGGFVLIELDLGSED
jgi:geranyl-CoA carboxylase alpha subunit